MFVVDRRLGSIKIVTPDCELVPITWQVKMTETTAQHYQCYDVFQKDKQVITRLAKQWPISGAYKRYSRTGPDRYSGKPRGTFFRGAKVLLGGKI